MPIVEAELTWTGRAFERGVRIAFERGRIVDVGPHVDGTVTPLARRALLPGFVNAHSHAFQRGLRGLGETFPRRDGSFWSWREAMYDLVNAMTRDRIYELALQAYREMLAAGEL